MNLDEALGELVREYGAPVIGERRLAGLLSDLGALDSPEMRSAAEAFSAGWYGKELLRLAGAAGSADLHAIADGIAAALVTNHGADPEAARRFAGSAAEAIVRAGSPAGAAHGHTAAPDSISGAHWKLPGGLPQRPSLLEHSWTDAEQLGMCRKAAAEGDAEAQRFLGEAYRYGRGVEQDYGEALGWFRKAAEQANSYAEAQLGDMHLFGLGTEKNNDEAFRWYLMAAEHGHAEAQNNVAFLFINGLGTEKNDAKAAEWYRRAAEQGLAPAELNLGDMYRDGTGVEQDYAEAVKWYRKAAEQGMPEAQSNLGSMYFYGQGVAEDCEEAAEWYRKAADQGNAGGEASLGWMLFRGIGVEEDRDEAERLCRDAAGKGSEAACNVLGRICLAKGGDDNCREAMKWFELAITRFTKPCKLKLSWTILYNALF